MASSTPTSGGAYNLQTNEHLNNYGKEEQTSLTHSNATPFKAQESSRFHNNPVKPINL